MLRQPASLGKVVSVRDVASCKQAVNLLMYSHQRRREQMPSYKTARGNTIRWGKMTTAEEIEAYDKMTPKVVLRQKEKDRRQPSQEQEAPHQTPKV
jgi:hypothetical protein